VVERARVAIINEMRCAMTATHSVDVQRNAAANQPADPGRRQQFVTAELASDVA
jgi:hypothetical protein